jgi:hypothetical protein
MNALSDTSFFDKPYSIRAVSKTLPIFAEFADLTDSFLI